jgi:hypothetical protein
VSDCLFCQGKISWWSALPGVFLGMAIFPPDGMDGDREQAIGPLPVAHRYG